MRAVAGAIRYHVTELGRVGLKVCAVVAFLSLFYLPTGTDSASNSVTTTTESARFYETAYQPGASGSRGLDYEKFAALTAQAFGIAPAITQFVSDYGLQDKRVLEVGSGRGYLQDAVADYTGLDISPTVVKQYHKPFVAGSATDIPFANDSFDAAWSIWVLEHISQPERALSEIRRVVRPGGILYLWPAWNCSSWAADGFAVRPYSDFNWRGKVVKASVPIRASLRIATLHPVRLARLLEYAVRGGETPLRFHALEPNYDTYWQADSDVVASLDRYEMLLWFRSRGDECLNCPGGWRDYLDVGSPLVIRVKPGVAHASAHFNGL